MSLEKKDGAVEKLMEEGTKQVESSGDKYDELKLDVSDHNIETAYAGMGKEELMKYANSPFWVRLRWLLFVMFWMSWFAMMFGALFIIFMTPKCFPSSKLEWYQKNPIYIINVSSLFNDTSLNGIDEKIEYMKNLGVQNVVLTSVLKSDNNGVTNFNETNNFSGEVYKDVIKKLKTNGMKVMLKFVPIHSSKSNMIFLRSALSQPEPVYNDCYIWSPGSNNGPINNWLTVDGKSAWTWENNRSQYYLHQFSEGEPDFNFRSEFIIKHFEDVFKHWLNLGFDGLYLDQVQYLLKDKDFRNESEVPQWTNKYNSLNHDMTSNLPETYSLLSNWGKLIKSRSGILIVANISHDIGPKNPITDVNMVHSSISLSHNFTGHELIHKVVSKKTLPLPSWEWVCSDPSKSWKDETIDAFNILGSLLPGIPFINTDPKLFENNQIPNITLIESTLKELRSLPAVEFGSFSAKLLNNDTLFTFTRIMSDSESLIFAWNLGENETRLNLNVWHDIPPEVNLSLCTQSACLKLPPLTSQLKSDNISLAAESAVVLKF